MRSRFDAYLTRLEMGGYIVTEDLPAEENSPETAPAEAPAQQEAPAEPEPHAEPETSAAAELPRKPEGLRFTPGADPVDMDFQRKLRHTPNDA